MHEQATLVAFYGEKPERLALLIGEIQEAIAAELGSAFSSYGIEQVHATIVGLEGTPKDPAVNLNGTRRAGWSGAMKLGSYLRSLREGCDLPFSVQLGGFADRSYPFDSRSQRPYLRSFSIQGEFAVLMGWPVVTGTLPEDLGRAAQAAGASEAGESTRSPEEERLYPPTLERIRRSAESFHILHQYHPAPDDFDNDFYLRLGIVDQGRIPGALASSLERRVRALLGERPATLLPVGAEDLSVVSYTDRNLPWPESRRRPLAEIDLDADLIGLFYTSPQR